MVDKNDLPISSRWNRVQSPLLSSHGSLISKKINIFQPFLSYLGHWKNAFMIFFHKYFNTVTIQKFSGESISGLPFFPSYYDRKFLKKLGYDWSWCTMVFLWQCTHSICSQMMKLLTCGNGQKWTWHLTVFSLTIFVYRHWSPTLII